MPLSPGTKLGQYEVVMAIGAGGMGEVYRARDTKLGRDVAIKVLHQEMATDSNRLRRFEQEARAASALNHPHIVTIYEIGEHEGTPYIAMEYVKGKTLRELLADGPLPIDKLMRYASQMAEGLAKAHQAGIVHRDLKPENIIITEDGYVKILDFGLAKLAVPGEIGSELATAVKEGTTPGTILGTVGYMSPEQAKGESADFRSDQFSLGLIVYEMASGAAAFQKEAAAQTLAAIIESEPEPLSERNADAPPALEGIVARLLSKNVDGRYDSTGDLSKDLSALRDGLIGSNVTSRGITAATAKRPLSWVGLAAISLSLVLGAWWWLRLSRFPPEQPAAAETERAPQVIAVLPFENIAADSSQDYFSAGMTEEISNQLSKLASLRVLSRAAVEPYRDTQDLSGMASELGVSSVVTGSVRVASDRVRVSVQLVNTQSKQTLWSEQYDRDLEDIFEVQSDVALQVVAALDTTLSAGEQERIETRPTESVAAYDLYLRAMDNTMATGAAGRREQLSLLQQAVELDPTFALAYALMARVLFFLAYLGDPAYAQQAIEMANRAIELQPDLSFGHSALGTAYLRYMSTTLRHSRAAFSEPRLWWGDS